MRHKGLLPAPSLASRSIHISWHVAAASTGVLAGTALSLITKDLFASSSWLVLAFSLLCIVVVKRIFPLIILAIVAGLCVGLWRGGVEQVHLADYEDLYGAPLSLKGRVDEDTSFGKNGDQRMRITQVVVNGTSYKGTVWVSTTEARDIKRGDIIKVSGQLTEGFGTIPAAMYRAQIMEIERPYPGDVGRRVRDWFSNGVYQALPANHAGLGLGYLVGQKQTLPEDISEQFRTTGLIHAVVASGFHLTVLVMVVRRMFGNVSKYLSALAAGSMMMGFIAVTGLSPSMTRAGLISGLSLLAWYYGRTIHPLVLLPFAAAITLLYQPSYIWGDLGWFLSFAAFSAVVVMAPLLNAYFWGQNRRPGLLRSVIITSLAAQLVTLPLTVYVFEYYSAYALLANLLIVPLVPLAMVLVFTAGLVGLFFPVGVAEIAGTPARLLLEYMIRIVDWISHLPYAKVEAQVSLATVILAYILLTLITAYLWLKTRYNFRRHDEFI